MAIDKKLAAKIKAAPGKLLKKAIAALNTFLKTLDPPGKVVSMGKSKLDAGVNFITSINLCIANDEAKDLPDDVIDFYNAHMVDNTEPDTAKDKPDKPKKTEKPEKKKAERDAHGFIIGSNHNKLGTLLSVAPAKMGDVKKSMGNTYYSLVAKHDKVFAKDAANQWYVIGSPAEKLITTQSQVDEARAKIDAEKKSKKDAIAKKKADVAKKEADAKAAKKDAKAKKDADKGSDNAGSTKKKKKKKK